MGAKSDNLATGINSQFSLRYMIAAVRVGEKTFRAFCGPFDRAADVLGGPDANHLFRVDKDFGPKTTTNVRCDHTKLMLRCQPVKSRNDQPCDVRVLACCIKRIALRARVISPNRSTRLHGIWNEPVVDNIKPRDVSGAFECGVRLGFVAEAPIEDAVVRRLIMHLRLGLHGLAGISYMRQFLITNLYGGSSCLGLLFRVGNHHCDMVADVAHFALRQDRVRADFHWAAVLGVDHPAAYQSANLVFGNVIAGEDASNTWHLGSF